MPLNADNVTELTQQGYTVIKNYLDPVEAKKRNAQFREIFGRLDKPVKLHSGMIQYIGHSKPQWELRHLCRPIFERLWDTTDLVTSFDGFCIMGGTGRQIRVEPDSFLHRDQNLKSSELLSYQGLVSLSDNPDIETGGFVCVPKTHLMNEHDYQRVLNGFRSHSDHWYVFSDTEKIDLYRNGYTWKYIPLALGDFLIWDTRLLHCNTKCYRPGAERIVSYICMVPRGSDLKIEAKRITAVQSKRTARHYPWANFKMFARYPRFSSLELKASVDRVLAEYDLTELDMQLV